MKKTFLILFTLLCTRYADAQINTQFIPSIDVGALQYYGSYYRFSGSELFPVIGTGLRFGLDTRHWQLGVGARLHMVLGSWVNDNHYKEFQPKNDVYMDPYFSGAYKFHLNNRSYLHTGLNAGIAINDNGRTGIGNEISSKTGINIGYVWSLNDVVDIEISEEVSYLHNLGDDPVDIYTGEQYSIKAYSFITSIGIRLNKTAGNKKNDEIE